jgi:hypothetical protein
MQLPGRGGLVEWVALLGHYLKSVIAARTAMLQAPMKAISSKASAAHRITSEIIESRRLILLPFLPSWS